MRKRALITSLLFPSLVCVIATAAQGDTLSLADMVREVKVALLQVAETTQAQHLPKLEKAVLSVNTSIKIDAQGKVNLWVIELGSGGLNEYSSDVTLTLVPPPPGSESNIGSVHLAEALSGAIIAGAQAIASAKEGKPPLIAQGLEASVRFALQRDASGKVGIKFPPFDASVGAGIASDQIQTIRVTYGR